MAVFTPREANELFGGNEGKQVLAYITRQGYGSREYQADGVWLPEPRGKVRGLRYNVDAVFPEVECVAGIWKYIKDNSIQTPERPDNILEQLATARLKPEILRLFSPWGPRYNRDTPRIENRDPETSTLREMQSVFERFGDRGFDIDLLLMPADTYGTEINGLSEGFVKEYFSWLEEWAYKELGESRATVKPWSAIREEQRDLYDRLRTEISQNLFDLIEEDEYRKAAKVAKIFNPEKAGESARQYCIERLVEANIISEVYDPIKLSLVRKEKDALDGPLKRIYVISGQNRAPWLKGE